MYNNKNNIEKDDIIENKKNEKKKGFTLIELLAVIIILGILMIIAIPSVTKYISDSRKSTYIDTAKEIISGARNLVNEGKLGMYDTDTTYYVPTSCIKTEGTLQSPYGNFDKAYVVVTYDGNSYNYYWMSLDETGQGIKIPISFDELDENKIESNLNSDDIILQTVDNTSVIEVFNDNCSDSTKPEMAPNGTVAPVRDCVFDGELVQGAEYTNGQYTYRYKQKGKAISNSTGVVIDRGWENISNDGWGVLLTDKDSTAPVTSKLCTSINDKPIVAMSAMFAASKASRIDFSSFDTSHVFTMFLMFAYAENLTNVDVSNFNTSSLQYFGNGFLGCSSLVNVNMDNWDFTNVVSVGAVFIGADNLKTLSMRNWKVPSSFNNFLFRSWSVPTTIDTVDVTNWDISRLQSLNGFFAGFGYPTTLKRIIGLETWNTSNIKDMNSLFRFNGSLTTLDLSSWDLSSVTDSSYMFQGCDSVTTAYARTQADADILNASSLKPSNINFITK